MEVFNHLSQPASNDSISKEANEAILKDFEKAKVRIIENIVEIESERDDIEAEIQKITDDYYHMLGFIKEQQQGVLENDAYIHAVQSRNAKKNQEYQDALNLLNKGAFQMVQGVNESEAEFQDRIKANAEIETADEQLFEAQEYTRNKFKENLKELVS